MSNMLEPRSGQQDVRSGVNIAAFFVETCAVTMEVFLHRHFGRRYFDAKAAAPLLIIPLFGALCFPQHDQGPLLLFLLLYLVGLVCARSEAERLHKKGIIVHSRYNGWPRSLPPTSTPDQELRAKSLGEPFLVGLWGAVFFVGWNAPLGAYFIVAAISLAASNCMYRMKVEREVADMSDALIEQQMRAERFRDLQGRYRGI